MGKDSTEAELPLIACEIARHASAQWGVPVIVAGCLASSEGEMKFLPKLRAGLPSRCPRFVECAGAIARKVWQLERQEELDDQWPIVSLRRNCPGKRSSVMVAVSIRFSADWRCSLVFGCLPASFECSAASRPKLDVLGTPGALSACRTNAERQAVLAAFIDMGRLAAAALACGASADADEEQLYALSRGFQRFYDDPESDRACCEALSGFQQIKAVVHLQVHCDGAANGAIQLKWFARRVRGRLAKLRRDEVRQFSGSLPLAGAVIERWHRCLPSFTFDSANLPRIVRGPTRGRARRETGLYDGSCG